MFKCLSAGKHFYSLLLWAIGGLTLFLSACNSTSIPPTQTPTAPVDQPVALTPTAFPTAQIPPTSTFPPLSEIAVAPLTPFPTLTPACPDTPKNRLIIGERGRVGFQGMRPLNIRADAGTEGRILGRLEVGEVFRVLDGPACRNGFAWYLIERSDGGLRGWVAEGEIGFYYIEPYLTG